MAPIWIHTICLVMSFLHLFWFCHACRLLNVSYLNPITNPTPCKRALTGRGSRVYPNNRGSQAYPNNWSSCEYPNNWGSQVYPNGWGSRVYPNGWGSRARPGQGRRCAWVSPLQLTLCARGLGFALTICATPACPWQQLNEFIYFN